MGCGGISKTWLTPLLKMPDAEVVALVDLELEQAKQHQAEFGLEHALVTTSLTEAIKQTSPDVVFDCTVPEAHIHVTLEALSHGCHVLGEKPLADTMEHAQQMVQTAQDANRIYAVIQNRRYQEGILTFRNMVRSGQLGSLTTLNADFYIGAHFGGFRAAMQHVLILDMAIHTFDQARLISGQDPVSVYCYEWNPRGSWYAHGANAVAIFEMTNGVVFTYRGSWCAEGQNTSWQGEWRAVCERGTALWNGEDKVNAYTVAPSEGLLWNNQEVDVTPVAALPLTNHAAIIREFLDCVKTGETPQTVCSDNIKSLAMVHAAIQSAETGQRVEIEF